MKMHLFIYLQNTEQLHEVNSDRNAKPALGRLTYLQVRHYLARKDKINGISILKVCGLLILSFIMPLKSNNS